jgi:hypothetical protein
LKVKLRENYLNEDLGFSPSLHASRCGTIAEVHIDAALWQGRITIHATSTVQAAFTAEQTTKSRLLMLWFQKWTSAHFSGSAKLFGAL